MKLGINTTPDMVNNTRIHLATESHVGKCGAAMTFGYNFCRFGVSWRSMNHRFLVVVARFWWNKNLNVASAASKKHFC